MTRRSQSGTSSTMLQLWRPPVGAGEPLGCLSSTYNFDPIMFGEQCLARFLGIDSEPNRESLAHMLEREDRLGSTYAGILVDHAFAGVAHSLRWDLLGVRVPNGKQHAKLSLLAWQCHVRLVVSSANMTRPGYRSNFEVASAVEFSAEESDRALLTAAISFLRSLLGFVSRGADDPARDRAHSFLTQVEGLAGDWREPSRSRDVRLALACTVPGRDQSRRSALDELIAACRSRGPLPHEFWVASPFFDVDTDGNRAADALSRVMARGREHRIRLCVPGEHVEGGGRTTRVAAPRALLDAACRAFDRVQVALVPCSEDKDRRTWHAKMIHCFADGYSALMVGSSNFTTAGLGLGPNRNVEANLVTLVDAVHHGRRQGELEAPWQQMEDVADPSSAEWIGPTLEEEDDGQEPPQRPPDWFLSATYAAGERRTITLAMVPEAMPDEWSIEAIGSWPGITGGAMPTLLDSGRWAAMGRPASTTVEWGYENPPDTLRATWGSFFADLPINVDDPRALPAPASVQGMTADDMLAILGAADPSAALRAWTRSHAPTSAQDYDPALDAVPAADLDPLNLYKLSDTFLHRVRRRARDLARLKQQIERPAPSVRALEWRLRGLIGVDAIATRFAAEFHAACATPPSPEAPMETLLTMTSLLMTLKDVRYEASDASITRAEFSRSYRTFLRDLAERLDAGVQPVAGSLPRDIAGFWSGIVEECRS